jgi:LysM repeat protein
MERTGKSLVIMLIVILWGLPLAWVHAQTAPPNPDPQQVSKPAPPKGYHVVEKGDTYYGLSRRYQVPVDTLKRWNGESLKQGTRVRVSFTAGGQGAKAAASKPQPAAVKPQTTAGKQQAPTGQVPTKAIVATKPAAPKAAAKPAAGMKTARPQPLAASTTRSPFSGPAEFSPANKEAQRVLVIPFDPYLYFSDADNDIAWHSSIPKQNVRYIFRTRLNAFVDPKGFESINLLGGAFRENQSELDRIYKSVTYSYQPVSLSKANPLPVTEKTGNVAVSWIQKQKEKFSAAPSPEATGNSSVARDPSKYYGVKVKDPDLYRYFNQHYAVDYYLFINQFEIHTDFTNCLDRTKNDFVREFLVHYTIFDNQGTRIAGNRVKVPYVSHVNDIEQIVRDNLNKMAQRILADLPQPQALNSLPGAVE